MSRAGWFSFFLRLYILERVSSLNQDQPLDNNSGKIKDVKVSCKCFDFLRQKWAFTSENICLASSFSYPSLDKPETMA